MMPVTTSFKVTMDARLLLAAMDRFGAEWTGERMEDALVGGAMLVVNDAKRIVHKITGTLSRSIHVGGHTELVAGFNPSEGYSDIRGNTNSTDGAVVFAGTNLVYAAAEEFGFHGKDSAGRQRNQEEHPYLRPAAYMNEAHVAEACAITLAQVLKSAGLT